MDNPVTGGLIDIQAFQDAASKTPCAVDLYRTTIETGKSSLKKLFAQAASADKLVLDYARFIDEILKQAWTDTGCAEKSDDLSLVAVGGYGRSELHPGSDIDLLILVEEGQIQQAQSALEKFLTFLWDIGLEIGQSVRTINECVTEARDDITIMTNLTESRHLAGSEKLYDGMIEATGPDRIWDSKSFFNEKMLEQERRHRKYDDTAYNLEPNIKEGPGGLRDIQTISWVAKRHFGANRLDELVDHDFLTENELEILKEGQTLLWKIRIALHLRNGRREDRLLFDHQKALAIEFGFHDDDQHLAVEHFMQMYYRTVMELNRLNEMLLQLFEEAILHSEESEEPVVLNERLQIRKSYLECVHDNVIEQHPSTLLEIPLTLMKNPEIKGVRASTIRQIRDNIELIDDDFRNNDENKALFKEIITSKRGLTHQLRRMNRYGILAAYIPAFANITGRMQYDLFHVYTVDEHSLFVVRNLRRFTVPEFEHEFPLCSEIIHSIARPWLVYIAGLFHDIAKGRGGDHSILGAKDAEEFCQAHDLTPKDTELVRWLVENHLKMSMTAQRMDISDPDVISEFADLVGDLRHLNFLYLLTVADMRATSPKLWNSWKNALLIELYESTKRALRRGLENRIDRDKRINEHKNQSMNLLAGQGIPEHLIQRCWQNFHENYFLHYTPDEIVWQTEAIIDHGDKDEPLVIARLNQKRGSTEVFVYTSQSKNAFAYTTAVFEQLGLDVVDARVMLSNDSNTLDTYLVLEENGLPIADHYRINEIVATIRKILKDGIFTEVSRRPSRLAKHFKTPLDINFKEDKANDRTILDLKADDFPGMLSKIGYTFSICNAYVQNARIATFGNRAEDVFFLVTEENEPLSAEQINCIEEKLKKDLG